MNRELLSSFGSGFWNLRLRLLGRSIWVTPARFMRGVPTLQPGSDRVTPGLRRWLPEGYLSTTDVNRFIPQGLSLMVWTM